MKVLITLFTAVLLTGCAVHSNKRLSTGCIDLIKSYNRVLTIKHICLQRPNETIYGDITSMPANEYGIYSTYVNKTVTVESLWSLNLPDAIRNIWDYQSGSYSYYGGCIPNPIFWPYPQEGPRTDDVFLSMLIPASALQSFSGLPNWVAFMKMPHVNLADIKCIKDYYLESKNGYINKSYPKKYADTSCVFGVVVKVQLNSKKTVLCYLVNYDMSFDANGNQMSDHVVWKRF